MALEGRIKLTDDQISWLRQLKMSKRAGVVRDYILEHGSVSTEVLSDLGYEHPPRAAMDLKDAGAGVAKVMVINTNGRRMASYSFNGEANQDGAGRVVIPKAFADKLKADAGYQCAICAGVFAGRQLQADHRVPFAIAGDQPEMIQSDFMPLCASDNRAKSWSCEHCRNWTTRSAETCKLCFWANPTDYTHVELRPERRLTVTFQGDEVVSYDSLAATAQANSSTVPQMVKDILSSEV